MGGGSWNKPFFLELLDVLVVEVVGHWDEFFVEPVIAGFVAADEQNGGTARVEGEKCSDWTAVGLGS